MKKTALLAAIPFIFSLGACSEPIDGSDTADLAPDAVSAGTGEPGDADYQPGEDGPLQNDVVPGDEPVEPVVIDDTVMEVESGDSDATEY